MNAKQSAQNVISKPPEQASWSDIMYELYVKQKIELGLKAVEENRTTPNDKVKAKVLNRLHK